MMYIWEVNRRIFKQQLGLVWMYRRLNGRLDRYFSLWDVMCVYIRGECIYT